MLLFLWENQQTMEWAQMFLFLSLPLYFIKLLILLHVIVAFLWPFLSPLALIGQWPLIDWRQSLIRKDSPRCCSIQSNKNTRQCPSNGNYLIYKVLIIWRTWERFIKFYLKKKKIGPVVIQRFKISSRAQWFMLKRMF